MAKPGRLKLRLVKLLAECGITVTADDLWCQQGAHRRYDGVRWGAHLELKLNGGFSIAHCWETMTECVANGITVARDKNGFDIEIHAKEKP